MPRDSLPDSSKRYFGGRHTPPSTKSDDRSPFLQNPRPQGGIFPSASSSRLSFTLNQHTLARRPRLLVLDEPTTGLDPVARREVLEELAAVLADDERTILFSSHNTLDVEQISDQITMIDRGRIVASADKEVFLD